MNTEDTSDTKLHLRADQQLSATRFTVTTDTGIGKDTLLGLDSDFTLPPNPSGRDASLMIKEEPYANDLKEPLTKH